MPRSVGAGEFDGAALYVGAGAGAKLYVGACTGASVAGQAPSICTPPPKPR